MNDDGFKKFSRFLIGNTSIAWAILKWINIRSQLLFSRGVDIKEFEWDFLSWPQSTLSYIGRDKSNCP